MASDRSREFLWHRRLSLEDVWLNAVPKNHFHLFQWMQFHEVRVNCLWSKYELIPGCGSITCDQYNIAAGSRHYFLWTKINGLFENLITTNYSATKTFHSSAKTSIIFSSAKWPRVTKFIILESFWNLLQFAYWYFCYVLKTITDREPSHLDLKRSQMWTLLFSHAYSCEPTH